MDAERQQPMQVPTAAVDAFLEIFADLIEEDFEQEKAGKTMQDAAALASALVNNE